MQELGLQLRELNKELCGLLLLNHQRLLAQPLELRDVLVPFDRRNLLVLLRSGEPLELEHNGVQLVDTDELLVCRSNVLVLVHSGVLLELERNDELLVYSNGEQVFCDSNV